MNLEEANLNDLDFHHFKTLIDACSKDDPIEYFANDFRNCRSSCDVHATGPNGETIAEYAWDNGKIKIAKYLHDLGIALNRKQEEV